MQKYDENRATAIKDKLIQRAIASNHAIREGRIKSISTLRKEFEERKVNADSAWAKPDLKDSRLPRA